MRIEKIAEEKYTEIKLLEEKLDSRLSPELKGELIVLNTNGAKNIILNLKEVKYADSSGLSAILTGNRLCQSAGGTFVLSNLSDHIKKLIKISHLENVLTIVPTAEEAREAIFMDEIERELNEQEEQDAQ
ncbi:MAG: anti-sigma factor antagonist [Bacteroidetes bacterium]|nr:MAG: anti-sigma factor antagonist [Bacteroidota bacterium]